METCRQVSTSQPHSALAWHKLVTTPEEFLLAVFSFPGWWWRGSPFPSSERAAASAPASSSSCLFPLVPGAALGCEVTLDHGLCFCYPRPLLGGWLQRQQGGCGEVNGTSHRREVLKRKNCFYQQKQRCCQIAGCRLWILGQKVLLCVRR